MMACLYLLLGELLKEAGLIARVTYWAGGFSFDENGITITVFPY